MGKWYKARGWAAKHAWRHVSSALRATQKTCRHECLIVENSALMSSYADLLVPALDAMSVPYTRLNTSHVRRQFGLSLAELRLLSAVWGCVVSFDHTRWPAQTNEVRLSHGIKPKADWSHRASLLLDSRGRPRYTAIGLPSRHSIREIRRLAPTISPRTLHLIGDLRADLFLDSIKPPNPRRVGVFSGWRPESLVPSLGDRIGSVLTDLTRDLGATEVVMTVHPRAQTSDRWPMSESSLLSVPGLRLLKDDEWEIAFADCASYVGDGASSMSDLLSMSGRPSYLWAGTSFAIAGPTTVTACEWTIGTAAQESAQLVARVMGAHRESAP